MTWVFYYLKFISTSLTRFFGFLLQSD